MKSFLLAGISLLALCASLPAHADPAPLTGRADVNWRMGTERSILMTEIWVPVMQDTDAVLYGDARLMGDDGDNREGNLGLGYRQLQEDWNAVIGGHVWIDRRLTERGSSFHQVTTGAEWLGDFLDVRANAYVPLSDAREYSSGTAGIVSNPYLAGTGIYVDRSGATRVIEEPQPGLDAEVGFRLPAWSDYIDSTRVYAGGYHFIGDKTEDVSGWRGRVAVDVNSAVSVGARFQRDDERGSQGFLEATVRFPFNAKKTYREEGLRARLDESPERDIDIVTSTSDQSTPAVTEAVVNQTTDNAQLVLHVDNTAASGGNGSRERPFDTLAAAQAAAQDYAVIYVHQGSGTTGMDSGITLDKTGLMMIGSGSNFVWDDSRFGFSGGSNNGFIIAPATIAPTIANQSSDNNSSGVWITGNDITVAGVNINGANNHGIAVYAGPDESVSNVRLDNINVQNATSAGVYIRSYAGGQLDNVHFSNMESSGNGWYGFMIDAGSDTGISPTMSHIENVRGENLVSHNNASHGIQIDATYGATTTDVILNNYESYDNNDHGVAIFTASPANTSTMTDIFLTNGIIHGNGESGINYRTDWWDISNTSLNFSDTEIFDNTQSGVTIISSQGASCVTANLSRMNIYNNENGILFYASGNASLIATLEDSEIINNNAHGLYVAGSTTGTHISDAGSGTPGTGNNSLHGNATSDLFRENTNAAISAQNNWWGQAGGPQGGQVSITGGGSVDTTSPLGTDPH